jgi:hypothetical protein
MGYLSPSFILKRGVLEGRSPSYQIIPPPLAREGDKGRGL